MQELSWTSDLKQSMEAKHATRACNLFCLQLTRLDCSVWCKCFMKMKPCIWEVGCALIFSGDVFLCFTNQIAKTIVVNATWIITLLTCNFYWCTRVILLNFVGVCVCIYIIKLFYFSIIILRISFKSSIKF